MTVVKIVELIGCSPKSWEGAVQEAVKKASKSLRNIRGADVKRMKVVVKNGKVTEYRANVKIAFVVE